MNLPAVDVKQTGKNIDKLRIQHGLSIKDIQLILGFTTPNAIYTWVHGKSMPTIDNLVVLAAIFKVSLDEIVITKSTSGETGSTR